MKNNHYKLFRSDPSEFSTGISMFNPQAYFVTRNSENILFIMTAIISFVTIFILQSNSNKNIFEVIGLSLAGSFLTPVCVFIFGSIIIFPFYLFLIEPIINIMQKHNSNYINIINLSVYHIKDDKPKLFQLVNNFDETRKNCYNKAKNYSASFPDNFDWEDIAIKMFKTLDIMIDLSHDNKDISKDTFSLFEQLLKDINSLINDYTMISVEATNINNIISENIILDDIHNEVGSMIASIELKR